MPVTIALGLALAFGLFALHQSVVIPTASWRAKRVWEGLASASCTLILALGLAWLFVHFWVSVDDHERATQTLARLERHLDWLDRLQTMLVGHWGWRLALGVVLLSLAGIVFAQAANVVRRVIWTVNRLRFAGTVLSILASLTITSVPIEFTCARAELRIAETKSAIAANVDAARRRAEQAIIAAAFIEAERAREEECAANAAACLDPYDQFLLPPPLPARQDVPALESFWRGSGVARLPPRVRHDRPVSVYDASIATLSVETSRELAARVDDQARARRDETYSAFADNIAEELFGVAADAGFDAMITAARSAGVEGEIVEAAAGPLFSDAFNETLAVLVEETTRSLLGGAALGDVIADTVSPTLRNYFASRRARQDVVAGAGRLNRVLRDAQTRGEPLIAPWRRARDAEDAARGAAASASLDLGLAVPSFDSGAVWMGGPSTIPSGRKASPPIFKAR